MLLAMNSSLAALQARQTLEKMTRLRNEIQVYAMHAKMLNSTSKNLDSLSLLDEATRLLRSLGSARLEFQGAESKIDSLSRALPSRPPQGGGMSPAAQWVPELRAVSRQFAEAVRGAEAALQQLRGTALAGLNSPTRTPTAPDNLFDVLLNFTDLLSRWVEHYRQTHPK